MAFHGSFGCDEILLIGDSNTFSGLNADGSTGQNPALDTADSRCLESRNSDTGVTARNCTNVAQDPFQYNNNMAAAALSGIGPGLTFMRDYYLPNRLAAGRNARITTHAVGGTGFVNGYWTASSTFTASISGTTMTVTGTPSVPIPFAGGSFTGTGVTANTSIVTQLTGSQGASGTYQVNNSQTVASTTMTLADGAGLTTSVLRMNRSIALDSRNVLTVILWCSGANDASLSVTGANYTTWFQNMVAYLRANLTGGSNVPILIQPLVPAMVSGNGAYATINTAQQNMPSNVSKCGWVDPSATGLSGNILGQNATAFHLTAGSQRLIGNPGFGNAWTNLSS